jgi:hypothetical protein
MNRDGPPPGLVEFCVIVGVLAAVAFACLLSWSALH